MALPAGILELQRSQVAWRGWLVASKMGRQASTGKWQEVGRKAWACNRNGNHEPRRKAWACNRNGNHESRRKPWACNRNGNHEPRCKPWACNRNGNHEPRRKAWACNRSGNHEPRRKRIPHVKPKGPILEGIALRSGEAPDRSGEAPDEPGAQQERPANVAGVALYPRPCGNRSRNPERRCARSVRGA